MRNDISVTRETNIMAKQILLPEQKSIFEETNSMVDLSE